MNSLHTPTGNWKYALLLSLFAALLWGILPVALKAMMSYMDPYTITWYRFLSAGVVSFSILAYKKGIPRIRGTHNHIVITLVIAALGLCGNYILYLQGLSRTGPGAAQVLIQLAPILLMLGGVTIFKESFTIRQVIGLICILMGCGLFFQHRLQEIFTSLTEYTFGVILIIGASVTWAVYALAQKQLLKLFTSQQILLLIFFSGTLVLLPTADPATCIGSGCNRDSFTCLLRCKYSDCVRLFRRSPGTLGGFPDKCDISDSTFNNTHLYGAGGTGISRFGIFRKNHLG